MSQIIINEKNFERFSRRMQKLLKEFTNEQVSLGKLQSQEIFSQILGSENLHELRTNLKKQKSIPISDYTYKIAQSDVDDFFNKKLNSENELKFIEKLELRMDYIIQRIADISGYDFNNWGHAFIRNNNSPSILNCIVYSYSPNTDLFKQDMKNMIEYYFEYSNKKIITYDKYCTKFPTTWLYEDFEIQLMDEVKLYYSNEIRKEYVQRKFKL